uniref:Uncharacterized protein n=1 Tax=Romanomermis culicivorax TaxID=13658 RepID=A0A915LBA1_ROMCU
MTNKDLPVSMLNWAFASFGNNQQPFQTNGFLLDDRSDQLTTRSEQPTEGISTQRPGTDELLALSTMYRQMTQVPQISSTEIYRPRPMHSTSQFEILMEQHQTRPPSVHHLGVVTSHLPEDDCFTRFTDPKNVPEECPLTQPGERLCLKANEFMSNMENVPMLLLMENEDKERFAADISHIVDDKQNNNGYSKYSDVPFIASSFKDYTVSKMIRYFASCLTGGNTCTFLTTYMTNVTNFHRPCKLG